MKESIGVTWILGLVMTFMVLFIAVLSASVNYNKAFRIKNRIIAMIEKEEGLNYEGEYYPGHISCGSGSTDPYCKFQGEIKSFLAGQGYSGHGKLKEDQLLTCSETNPDNCENNSFEKVCYLSMYDMGLTPDVTSRECSLYIQEFIAPRETDDANLNVNQTDPAVSNRIYYRITTFFTYDIPILGVAIKIPVSGDTKAIYDYRVNIDLINEGEEDIPHEGSNTKIEGKSLESDMLMWKEDTNGNGKIDSGDEMVKHTHVDLMEEDNNGQLGLATSFSIAVVDTALKLWGSAGTGIAGILPFQ